MDQTLEYQRTSNTQSRLMKRVGLFNASKPGADDDADEDLDPLSYVARGKPKRRERLEDDDD